MKISGIQKYTLLDFPDKISCIVFLPGCNFRCGYCHNPEFVLPNKISKIKDSFIDEDVFLNFLKHRQGLLDGVVISGGEPTIYPNLSDFIKKIRGLGFLVKLDTNGSNPKMLSFLIEDGLLDYIAMDVKTELAKYIMLVGKSVDIGKIKHSIEIIISSGVDYEFRSTIIKELHDEDTLRKMAILMNGAKRLYLQGFRSKNTLDLDFGGYSSYTETELKEFAHRIFSDYVSSIKVRK